MHTFFALGHARYVVPMVCDLFLLVVLVDELFGQEDGQLVVSSTMFYIIAFGPYIVFEIKEGNWALEVFG